MVHTVDKVMIFQLTEYINEDGISESTDRDMQLKLWAISENQGTGIMTDQDSKDTVHFEFRKICHEKTDFKVVHLCKIDDDSEEAKFFELTPKVIGGETHWIMDVLRQGERHQAVFEPAGSDSAQSLAVSAMSRKHLARKIKSHKRIQEDFFQDIIGNYAY